VYRVITKYRDSGSSRPVVERGPWHSDHDTAEYWADILRALGYVVEIQSQHMGHAPDDDNRALADALSSMA